MARLAQKTRLARELLQKALNSLILMYLKFDRQQTLFNCQNKKCKDASMKFKLLRLLSLQGRFWWSALFWLAFVAPAAAMEIRVAIERGVEQIKVGSSTTATIRDYTSGKALGQLAAMNAFYAQPDPAGVALAQVQSSAMWVEPSGNGYVFIGDRWYRGRTLLLPAQQGVTAVNYVDLEQYLYSVLGGEMNGNWHQEALKAQAVAARTYAVYKRENESNGVYDVLNTQASQVYKGIASESPGTHAAVNATTGQILTYNNKPILAAFHACSGGHTENVEDVWSQPLPYLRGVAGYDDNVTACQWVKTVTGEELNQKITGIGTVQALTPVLSPYGSVKSMKFIGDRGTRELRGDALRTALGLRSTRFTITAEPLGLRFDGRGWGHGLGMSQWGAYNLAQQGVKYQQILSHYYRGASLAQLKR